MIRKSVVILAGAALLGFGIRAIADDATTNPSPEPRSTRHRLIAPYNMLTDLTDDQKSKIRDIHGEILDEEKQLLQKEKDEISAVLTDDQKKELDDLEAKAAAEKKASAAEKRAKSEEEKAQELKAQAEGAATQPSGGQ